MTDAERRLIDFLDGRPEGGETAPGLLMVVTGAGVSVASGIPSFRGTDEGAIWHRDVLSLGTFAYFQEDPVGSWRWYLDRFDRCRFAKPNAAHRAIAALERWHRSRGGEFLLVTQNVDTLHEDAGSEEMVKVHGSADRVRCARVGCDHGAPTGSLPRASVDLTPFVESPSLATLPRCASCDELLRQHVLWFDEDYFSHVDYRFDRVAEAALRAERVLFVGTSFSVGVTDAILHASKLCQASLLSIDPGGHAPPRGLPTLRVKAEDLLPDVCAEVGAS